MVLDLGRTACLKQCNIYMRNRSPDKQQRSTPCALIADQKWDKRPVTLNPRPHVSSNYVARMHGMKSAHLLIFNNRNLHSQIREEESAKPKGTKNIISRRFVPSRADRILIFVSIRRVVKNLFHLYKQMSSFAAILFLFLYIDNSKFLSKWNHTWVNNNRQDTNCISSFSASSSETINHKDKSV